MNPWRQVFLLVGAGVVASFQIGKVPPVLPLMRADLSLSLVQAGWIISIFGITGMLLGPLAGSLADRLGHRRLLLGGLMAQGIGSLAGSLATDLGLLLGTRFLEGLGLLVIASSAPTLIYRVAPPDKTRLALGVWSGFVPLGMTLVMLLTPMIAGPWGWRGLWQANGLLLIGYALFLMVPAGKGTMTRPRAEGRWRDVFRNVAATASAPGPLLMALTFTTYALQWVTVMAFFPTLLMENRGFAAGASSWLTAVMVAVNVPGNLLGGWLLQRGFRRGNLLVGACLTMGIAGLVIFYPGFSFSRQYAACLIFSGVGGLIPAAIFGASPVLAPHPRLLATTNGLILQGSNFGQVLGPPLLAWTVSATGTWQSAPWILGSAAGCGVVLSGLLGLWERKVTGDTAIGPGEH